MAEEPQFTYRGKDIDEMSLEECREALKSCIMAAFKTRQKYREDVELLVGLLSNQS